ncbi:MAG: helix-turn-helix transcriptional regulator [Clostridiales bacterium]|nr:helix-turn-helix transcriptional regulator [Clostridiales bacterium]
MAEFDSTRALDEPQLALGLRLMESIIGGRWNPMILFAIEQGASRFTDIRNHIVHISDTELQRKLASLTQSRLVEKVTAQEDARRGEYALTRFGGDITHILHHILDISYKHLELEGQAAGEPT